MEEILITADFILEEESVTAVGIELVGTTVMNQLPQSKKFQKVSVLIT